MQTGNLKIVTFTRWKWGSYWERTTIRQNMVQFTACFSVNVYDGGILFQLNVTLMMADTMWDQSM